MNRLLALLMGFAIPLAVVAGDNSYKVTYDGGSRCSATRTIIAEC